MRTWFAKQTNDAPVASPTAALAEAVANQKAAIKPRRMVYAPVRASGTEARPEGEIRIKAQLDANGKQIVLMIDRPILQGYSYWSSNLDDAQRMSPLAAALRRARRAAKRTNTERWSSRRDGFRRAIRANPE